MDRRKFIIGLSALIGCSVSSVNALAVDSALAFDGKVKRRLAGSHFNFIALVADIIIPQTETPSASQAGVPLYIDFYIHHFLNDSKRATFIANLAKFVTSLTDIASIPETKQVALIQALDNSIGTPQENGFYRELKQLVVIGYYTSETGATQALKYDPVPGPYKEMKFKDVGGVWF